jgi:hypothetical protein
MKVRIFNFHFRRDGVTVTRLDPPPKENKQKMLNKISETIKILNISRAPVAHAWNPSYLAGS